MPKLIYNSENKRIVTSTANGVAVIPSEDTENERIVILSGSGNPDPDDEFILDFDGYYTVNGQEITEEYLDPETLGLSVDSEGYIEIGA